MKAIEKSDKLQDFHERFGSSDGLFYVGHASVLVGLNGYKILFDPIVLSAPYDDSWVFYPPQITDPSFFDVDAVFISHIHQDHYDVEYLKSLNTNAKVVIIGGRPSFEEDLIANGIKNVTIVEPEVVTEVLKGVFIYGVLHETNGIDSSALIFNDEFCVYHGNDNYITPATVQKFVDLGPSIDVACIPYAYIHWYPFLMKDDAQDASAKKAEGDRLVRHYMDDCIEVARKMSARLVIPFGANLILDDGDAYSDINAAVRTPLEFCDYVSSVAPDLIDIVKPMLAGDYCGPVDGNLEVVIHGERDGATYRAEADSFLRGRPRKVPDPEWDRVDKELFVSILERKLAAMPEHPDHTIRVELDYLNEVLKIEIDCREASARWVDEYSRKAPYHHFRLDPIASGEWLNGKRFEEIIGMRRFTLEREPNRYCPDILRLVQTIL